MIAYVTRQFKKLLALLLVCLLVPFIPLHAYFSETLEQLGGITSSELMFGYVAGEYAAYVGVPVPEFETFITLAHSAASVENLYAISVGETVGDGAFCGALELGLASELGSEAGELAGLALGDFTGTSAPTEWEVTFELDTGELAGFPHGAGCAVELMVHSWQAETSKDAPGFSDRESIMFQLTADQIVLNEVLADPGSTEFVEFIELYNLGSADIDVAGWTIEEFTSGGATTSHEIVSVALLARDLVAYDDSGSTVVPAGGWLSLKFGGSASYLNNSGDTIILRDATGRELDRYVYEDSKSGYTDARMPDGVGDWVDPIPTPGAPNFTEQLSLSELSVQLALATVAEAVDEEEEQEDGREAEAGSSGGGGTMAATQENEEPIGAEETEVEDTVEGEAVVAEERNAEVVGDAMPPVALEAAVVEEQESIELLDDDLTQEVDVMQDESDLEPEVPADVEDFPKEVVKPEDDEVEPVSEPEPEPEPEPEVDPEPAEQPKPEDAPEVTEESV